MVIASNEWLNNYDDEQKSASGNTTTTTTSTTNNTPTNYVPATSTTPTSATTAAVSSSSTVVTTISTATTETTIQIPSTVSQTIPSPSTAIDNSVINISSNNSVIEQQPEQCQQESKQQHTPKQQQQQQQVSVIIKKNHTMDDSLKGDRDSNEIENNNSDEANTAFINNSSLLPTSHSNTSIQTIVGSSTNISTSTNTATTSNSNQQYSINTSYSPNYNPNPITPQALSKALQSALNATSHNAGMTANLPNNFLSSLSGIGLSANATLQHTTNLAKQLSSSLYITDSHTISSNNPRNHQQLLADNNGQARIVLQCEPNSHPFQTRSILLTPNIECKVGRLIAKSKASESNAIFDCKVLSRNHAVLWYSNDGKFWVKDTKSSNGTFINENKLGTEAAELHFGDVVKFGVDVMENSRKEVHGCIIAGVNLYLPDGRETISIESAINQLSPHTGEGRISYDELHRLNLYMQEASQREKVLKMKLFNIQNILDATRKNSALCWQSMIAEDQLLHRIHSLEKKLQIMEKNVPENVLKTELMKLIDDKNAYQHSAKEALRKVYQERCDAMQMLSKMEAAFTASDNECKILRDQIMNTKQSLQDVNERLLCLEAEYNDFKDENDRQQQEAKEQSEKSIAELMEKYKQRDFECKDLQGKMSELLIKRAHLLLGEKHLEKQAIENLDAAIADMGLSDGNEQKQDENYGKENDGEQVDGQKEKQINAIKASPKQGGVQPKSIDILNGDGVVVDEQSDSYKEKLNSKFPKSSEAGGTTTVEDSNKRSPLGQKSTILKWLENSDINKKDGLLDIFDAICNESDSSDGSEKGAGTDEAKNNNEESPKNNDDNQCEDFTSNCSNFSKQLRNVEQNLSKLEAEINNESKKTLKAMTSALGDNNSEEVSKDDDDSDGECEVEGNDEDDDDDDDDEIEEDDEILTKRIGEESNPISKTNENYLKLKTSVAMLREAYNEICVNMKQQKQQQKLSSKPAISVQTQFNNYAQHKISKTAARKLSSQMKAIPTNEEKPKAVQEAEEHNSVTASGYEADNADYDDDSASDATGRLSRSSLQTIKGSAVSADEGIVEPEHISTGEEETRSNSSGGSSVSRRKKEESQLEIEAITIVYKEQIRDLKAKLEFNEIDLQNTLQLMKIECDVFKNKLADMTKMVEALNEEKQALEQVITENKSNTQKTAACLDNKALPAAAEGGVVIKEQLKQSSLSAKDENTEEVETATQVKEDEQLQKQQQQMLKKSVQPVVAFEQQMHEELAAINNGAMEREEELIMYKERLEKTQCDNLRLQQEITEVMRASDAHTLHFLKSMMPYGVVAIAIIVYFIYTYF